MSFGPAPRGGGPRQDRKGALRGKPWFPLPPKGPKPTYQTVQAFSGRMGWPG
jgi:hypothetical protein